MHAHPRLLAGLSTIAPTTIAQSHDWTPRSSRPHRDALGVFSHDHSRGSQIVWRSLAIAGDSWRGLPEVSIFLVQFAAALNNAACLLQRSPANSTRAIHGE